MSDRNIVKEFMYEAKSIRNYFFRCHIVRRVLLSPNPNKNLSVEERNESSNTINGFPDLIVFFFLLNQNIGTKRSEQ